MHPANPRGARSAGGSYRWTVLAVGTGAQASTSAFFQGLAAIGPPLRDAEHLSLAGLGLLLGAPGAGMVLTLLLWGRATDRFGERAVMAAGLFGATAGLAIAAGVHGLWPLSSWLLLTGGAGASVNAASGRAVLTWFPPDRARGAAMGVRQTAVPLGAALAALGLPSLVAVAGVPAGMRALAMVCLLAALAVLLWMREPVVAVPAVPRRLASTGPPDEYSVLRDSRLWRLSAASSLLVVPQFTIVAFTVEVLHGYRHVAASSAAFILAVAQLSGAVGRLLVGHWSDRVRSQLRPLRALALAMALGGLVLGATVNEPVPLLEAALVVEGALVICWNGLAYTAAGEIPPTERVGTALALQNTANFVSVAVTPSIAGLVINFSGFAPGFSLIAVPAATSAVLLSRLAREQRSAERDASGADLGAGPLPSESKATRIEGVL